MADEWVTLENNGGQSIRLKLLSLQDNIVHIQMQNGRNAKTPLSVYNEASQAHIRQHFYQRLLVPKNFDVKFSEVRLPNKNRHLHTKGSMKITDFCRAYSISLKSHIPVPLHDIRLEYIVFHFQDVLDAVKSTEGRIRRVKGQLKLANLDANAQQSLQTEPIDMSATKLLPHVPTLRGGARSTRDRLKGIWIKLYVGDQLVLEQSQPARLATNEVW